MGISQPRCHLWFASRSRRALGPFCDDPYLGLLQFFCTRLMHEEMPFFRCVLMIRVLWWCFELMFQCIIWDWPASFVISISIATCATVWALAFAFRGTNRHLFKALSSCLLSSTTFNVLLSSLLSSSSLLALHLYHCYRPCRKQPIPPLSSSFRISFINPNDTIHLPRVPNRQSDLPSLLLQPSSITRFLHILVIVALLHQLCSASANANAGSPGQPAHWPRRRTVTY